jgi:hypothetical protein
MPEQALLRRKDGKFAGVAVVQSIEEEIDNRLRIVPRREAGRRLKRGQTQVAYYHRLAALNSDSYKILLARRKSQKKPKPKDPTKKHKRNGLCPLVLQGKFIPGWVVDLKKPIREPQFRVLKRIRDEFKLKNEPEVIAWIKANEETIKRDLGVLLHERYRELEWEFQQRHETA